MAAGDISVVINSETKSFKSGVQNGIIEPLDDAVDALDKLGKAKGPEQLEREMRDAQQATEKLEDELGDARRDLEKLGFAARDAGRDGQAGLGKIQRGAQEAQQEIGQNLGEAVSSIRGDISDLGQVGQDTLGGLAATLAGTGPAGLVGAAALAAGAVGLGLITAELQEQEERQERIKEQAGEWATAYEDAANRIVSSAHIVGEMNDIASDPERYQQAKDSARDWGVHVSDAMRAMAGDATALELVQASLNEKQRDWADILKETSTGSNNSWDRSTMTDEQRELGEQLRRGTDALAEQNEAMAIGSEIAENRARALHDFATAAGTATGEVDDLGNAIYRLPDGKEIVVDARTGKAYEDLDAIEKRSLAEKTITVRADTSQAEAALRSFRQNADKGLTVNVSARMNRVGWE